MMRYLAILLLLFCGCEQIRTPPPPKDFSSSVTVTTVNGYVQSVDVYLPRDTVVNNQSTTSPALSVTVADGVELDELIESLKTTVSELEDAKSRMLVEEQTDE